VRISAKTDYAVRAAAALAAEGGGPIKGETLATSQGIPQKFLENILSDMRHAGLIRSQRGADGGYWLARSAEDITVADIIRAVDGPLASVRGIPPEEAEYVGPAEALRDVWFAVRANTRAVVEQVTLAALAANDLPQPVRELARDPDAQIRR